MKKIVYLLLLFSACIQAQITDEDAKIQYQQAEDYYNKGVAYQSAHLTGLLKEKMGKWTPKVLFLYLKSYYALLKDDEKITDAYRLAEEMSELCNTLNLQVTEINNYPIEKKNEIAVITSFFNNLKEKYSYQKGRTIYEAINFLNDSGKKFPPKDSNPTMPQESSFIDFELNGSILKVIIGKSYSEYDRYTKYTYRRKTANITYIDLSTNFIVFCDSWTNNDYYRNCGKHCYLGSNEIKWFDERGNEFIGFKGCVSKKFDISQNTNGKIDKEYNNFFSTVRNVSSDIAFKEWRPTKFDFTQDPCARFNGAIFDETSSEFIDGDYSKRIWEVFDFLANSFKVAKTEPKKIQGKF